MKALLHQFLAHTVVWRGFRECDRIDAPRTGAAVRHVIDSPDVRIRDGNQACTMLFPYLWQRAVTRGQGAPP
jgi:hypothetical protein